MINQVEIHRKSWSSAVEEREELTVILGAKAFGTGIEHKITIPLQEIAYSDFKKGFGKHKGKKHIEIGNATAKISRKCKGLSYPK